MATHVANSKIEVQELSVQWLSFTRVKKYIHLSKEDFDQTSLNDMIQKIVKTYNKIKKEKEKEAQEFELVPTKIPTTAEYTAVVYEKTLKVKTKLAQAMRTPKLPRSVSTDYLLFFSREKPEKEIVALTSGQAFQVVRRCIQYEFPIKVAERLLDADRIVEISRICLIGPESKEIIQNPRKHELYKTASLYYLIESFKCKVRSNSCLMELPFLSEKKEPPLITIRTGGLLRIHRRFSLGDYSSLFALFSQYVRGEKTFTAGGVEEVGSFQFELLQFLRPAHLSKDKLDFYLVERLFKDREKGVEQTIHFRHKYLNDYLTSSSYEILCPDQKRYQLLSESPPSLDEVIEFLLNSMEDEDLTAETLLEALKTGKFRYLKQDGKLEDGNLIDFLEGEARSEKGDSYFKVRGMWYELTGDYQGLLHEDFKSLLEQTFIKNEEAQLPTPWAGNAPKGKVTEDLVKDKFQIKKGIRAFMKALKEAKVAYVDEKNRVKQKILIGEILTSPVILRYKDKIEKELLSLEELPSSEKIRKLFDKDADAIEKDLKKEREILYKNYVRNPFPYPMEKHPDLKGKYDNFIKFLEESCAAYYIGGQDEETYNRTYLYTVINKGTFYGPEEGYLVFDQICPHLIEPCDVIKYTKDTTYLYHVKESFGQDTRIACSQALNAAREFRSALSLHQAESYLETLWRRGIEGNEGWKVYVKKQLKFLGKDNFFKIFYDRKIVFVYAYLETQGRSMQDEATSLSCLTASDVDLGPTKDKNAIYEKLKEKRFLDNRGILTGKFLACTSKEKFCLEGFKEDSKAIYARLDSYSSVSRSTIAKLELLHLAKELRALNFEFRICEIKRSDQALEHNQREASAEEAADDLELDESSEEEKETPPKKMESLPAKLQNIKNSCYMNAVLQVLFSIPPICELIKLEKNPLQEALTAHGKGDVQKPLLETLRSEAFKTHKFPWGLFSQQDAHEFMTLILDQLKWLPLSTCTLSQGDDAHQSKSASEPHSHLSIALASGISSFQELLDTHFAEENVNDDNKRVIKGKGFNEFTQTTLIDGEFPQYLIVQLKRFKTGKKPSDPPEKILAKITFPEDGIVTLSNKDKEKGRYEIVAYINHHGSTIQNGHYTADIKKAFRNPEDEELLIEDWVHCDDTRIIKKNPENPEKDAYLIVLKKKEEESESEIEQP